MQIPVILLTSLHQMENDRMAAKLRVNAAKVGGVTIEVGWRIVCVGGHL